MHKLLVYILATPIFAPIIIMWWGATTWIVGILLKEAMSFDFNMTIFLIPLILGYFGLMAALDLVEFVADDQEKLENFKKTYFGVFAGIIAIGCFHLALEPAFWIGLFVEIPPIVGVLTLFLYVERRRLKGNRLSECLNK